MFTVTENSSNKDKMKTENIICSISKKKTKKKYLADLANLADFKKNIHQYNKLEFKKSRTKIYFFVLLNFLFSIFSFVSFAVKLILKINQRNQHNQRKKKERRKIYFFVLLNFLYSIFSFVSFAVN